jgi:hypothetical protein
MSFPKINKDIKVLVIDYLHIRDTDNILNNLPNGLEYLFINFLQITNTKYELVNNLPQSIKKVGVRKLAFGCCSHSENYEKQEGLILFNDVFKFPYNCEYTFGNIEKFDIDIKNKKYIQVIYNQDTIFGLGNCYTLPKNKFELIKNINNTTCFICFNGSFYMKHFKNGFYQ